MRLRQDQQPAAEQQHFDMARLDPRIAFDDRVDRIVALAEIARYRPGIVRCAPEVANLEVSGVFSLEDTDRALLNLTLGLPVDLVYRTRYWVTVQAR